MIGRPITLPFKTVRASFNAHGSSFMTQRLSFVPVGHDVFWCHDSADAVLVSCCTHSFPLDWWGVCGLFLSSHRLESRGGNVRIFLVVS